VKKIIALLSLGALALMPISAMAETSELRIPLGAGGFGFLPLHMMKKYELIEKKAAEAGLKLTVNWSNIGGPSVMNDALLSGSADFISAGPPAFLILWDRTKGGANVKGVAAMSTMPMYLNTSAEHLRSLDDLKDEDKIAVTAVKVSIPAIIMQMAALKEWGKEHYARLDPLTVSMSHPDAMAAFLSKRDITAHFTSPPFMYKELEQPGIHRIMSSDDVMGGPTTFSNLYSTSKFHDANPRTFKAVLAAFSEAIDLINKDKKAAAEIYLKVSGDKKSTVAEIQKQIEDPNLLFTTIPRNIQKYADFMYEVGSIKSKAASWKDLYFPEIHHLPGS